MAKYTEYFLRNQRLLLELVNTPEGKDLLGLSDEAGEIIQVDPAGVHIYKGIDEKGHKIQAFIFTSERVAEIFTPILDKLDVLRTEYAKKAPVGLEETYKAFLHYAGLEEKYAQYPIILLTTDTFTNLGFALSSGSSGNYTTVRNGNSVGQDGSSTGTASHSFDGANYGILRQHFVFDTTTINDSAIIDSSFIRLPGAGSILNVDTDTVNIVSSSIAGDGPLTSEWTNVGSTSFASLAIASWNSAGNNDLTLDANGLANLSATAKSKFATRLSRDLNNSAPTGNNRVQMTIGSIVLSITYHLPTTTSTTTTTSTSTTTTTSTSTTTTSTSTSTSTSSTTSTSTTTTSTSTTTTSTSTTTTSTSSSTTTSTSTSTTTTFPFGFMIDEGD